MTHRGPFQPLPFCDYVKCCTHRQECSSCIKTAGFYCSRTAKNMLIQTLPLILISVTRMFGLLLYPIHYDKMLPPCRVRKSLDCHPSLHLSASVTALGTV